MTKNKAKNNKRSRKIRWKLFFAVLIPSIILILVLWVMQTVFLGYFYGSIKEDELKQSAQSVVSNLNSESIGDRILYLSSNGDINIRVIETQEFETLYSSGEVFDSVTFGWGDWGMLQLYWDTENAGGELLRYYSEETDKQKAPKRLSPSEDFPEGGLRNEAQMREFRRNFKMVPEFGFFDNIGRHNDLLYSLITTLEDGTEVMVVADTRISPLDSTVKALKYQLVFCSLITVMVSLAVSYFMSRKVAKPIEKLNKSAHRLAGGSFDESFEAKGYREIEELGDTLNYASTELNKVDKLRHELLANVSHDMRTPLTMIVGYGEMMRDIPGENTPENVQLVIDEAKRLSEFVNNVLDLSKLETGMQELSLEKINITKMLQEVTERYKGLVTECELDISFEYSHKAEVVCDEAKMIQAIHNLVDNAINYADEPKKVRIKQKLIGRDKLRIEICDNGDGIDKEQLPYIWDRYYRSDKNHRRNVVGSGIGLSIVKEVFALHKIKFGVETKKGEGSVFWFEMNIAK